jgi:hypothetical protein
MTLPKRVQADLDRLRRGEAVRTLVYSCKHRAYVENPALKLFEAGFVGSGGQRGVRRLPKAT